MNAIYAIPHLKERFKKYALPVTIIGIVISAVVLWIFGNPEMRIGTFVCATGSWFFAIAAYRSTDIEAQGNAITTTAVFILVTLAAAFG
jgi:hypothetical protein